MIEIAPDIAFLAYLGITLLALLGLWTYSASRASKRKLVLNESELYVCEYCKSVYMDTRAASVTRCPECKSLNNDNVYSKSRE